MRLLKGLLAEIIALFVDNGSLVVAVIAWVLAGAVCLWAHWVDPASDAVLLAAGIAVLLVENVVRSARAHVNAAQALE
jgi:hypothetical protein